MTVNFVQNHQTVPTSSFFELAEEFLEHGYAVRFTVTGNSMFPLLRHRTDSVLLIRAMPKVGDLVLLRTKDHAYILHRIVRKTSTKLITMGDGCLLEDEPIDEKQVLGIAEFLYRGHRTIPCRTIRWRILFAWWRWLKPIRMPLLKGYRWCANWKRQLRKREQN